MFELKSSFNKSKDKKEKNKDYRENDEVFKEALEIAKVIFSDNIAIKDGQAYFENEPLAEMTAAKSLKHEEIINLLRSMKHREAEAGRLIVSFTLSQAAYDPEIYTADELAEREVKKAKFLNDIVKIGLDMKTSGWEPITQPKGIVERPKHNFPRLGM
jgi:vacuolar-type H+-ATPase subunit I/STV1